MCDEGEKTCPLCAEEMDLTDQQLKPCKCGYQICVWCWHHIMDMAEKDESEGRCPACRSPYDKQKIVGMAANCERLVAEINMERKMKNQKAKTKSTEGRKQLGSVRVIQRNLVYIVGLPLNFADEDLLQRRDYFGQYGKVLKVSMSRTAAGVVQQFQNNTCSVYITYSKEEEAIRCIQNVHGFVLDGRPLRACFGTTKYCHAWLRNMPCNNPDCLYLHEIGSQEDSFTKDEIISAYTRSRVQQVTGAANNMQRRSGNLLPPPVDDYTNNSSGKPIVRNASSNLTNTSRGSPPNGSSGRSTVLPAGSAWGARGSSGQTSASDSVFTNGLSKQKSDTNSCMLSFSSAVSGTVWASVMHSDAGKQSVLNDEIHSTQPKSKAELSLDQPVGEDNESNASNVFITDESSAASVGQFSCPLLSKATDRCTIVTANTVTDPDEDQYSVSSGEEISKLCSDISVIDVSKDDSELSRLDDLSSDHVVKSPDKQGLQQQGDAENSIEGLITVAGTSASPVNVLCATREELVSDSISRSELLHGTVTELDDDVLSFDSQRLNDPEVCPSQYPLTSVLHLSNHFKPIHNEPYRDLSENVGSLPVDDRHIRARNGSLLHLPSITSDGYPEKLISSISPGFDRTLERAVSLREREQGCPGRSIAGAASNGGNAALDNSSGFDKTLEQAVSSRDREQGHPGRSIGGTASNGSNSALDKGESSIITDILSMDFDPWEDSLTSPHNLAKLLCDAEQMGPLKASNSWKAPINNQSKFSFARQDTDSQGFVMHQPLSAVERHSMGRSHTQDFAQRDLYMERMDAHNNFSPNNLDDFENLGGSHPLVLPTKIPDVSRSQISAPPGFSVPSRPPPPGFPSQDRINQAFDSMPGNSFDVSLQNSYHTLASGSGSSSTADIEFMDPAILAVGKGRMQGAANNVGLHMRSNVSQQLNSFDEATLQLLMQRSLISQQNLGFSELANSFPHLGDSYGISSRFLDQSQVSNLSPLSQFSLQQSGNTVLSNGHWDGWNEVQGNNRLGVADLLRNDRLGFNKFYDGYDDGIYRRASSGNVYNRTFGM